MERVLTHLGEGARHFNQLKELTKFSATTLDSILKEIQNEKKIRKIIHHNREAYALTGKGHRAFGRIWYLLDALEELRNNGGGYVYVRPVTEWGLSFHQAMNKVSKKDNADFPFLIPSPLVDKKKLEEFFLPIVVKEIEAHRINLENPKSKVIFAIELDAEQFGKFFKKILHFMDLVIHEKDILRDEALGFAETKNKAALFEKYVYYAGKFNNHEFQSKLEQCKRRLANEGIQL